MFFAIVGNPPFIEDILREKALPYRRYELDKPEQAAQMMREMPQQKAILRKRLLSVCRHSTYIRCFSRSREGNSINCAMDMAQRGYRQPV